MGCDRRLAESRLITTAPGFDRAPFIFHPSAPHAQETPMTSIQNNQGKQGHDKANAVTVDRLADMLSALPASIRGIFGNMPGIDVEDETTLIDALTGELKARSMSIVHIHADFLSADRSSAIETVAQMLPARDGSEGPSVVIVSGLGGSTRDNLGMIDAMVVDNSLAGGDIPENAKFMVVRSTSSHDPRMLSRLVNVDLALPPVAERPRRRTARS